MSLNWPQSNGKLEQKFKTESLHPASYLRSQYVLFHIKNIFIERVIKICIFVFYVRMVFSYFLRDDVHIYYFLYFSLLNSVLYVDRHHKFDLQELYNILRRKKRSNKKINMLCITPRNRDHFLKSPVV